MVRAALRFDRRALLTSAGALGLGMAAVGGLAAADSIVRTPTLAIIGEESAQFALLRTRGAKIGFLFGPPTKTLLAAIAPMLGWTAPALDVLAVSPIALTSTSGTWLAAASHLRSLLVLGPIAPSQMPALKPGVRADVATSTAAIALAHGVHVDIHPGFSIAAINGAAIDIGAIAAIRREGQTITMLDQPLALGQHAGLRDTSLLVLPAGDLRPIAATRHLQAVAMNSNGKLADRLVPADLPLAGNQIAVVRTFVNEPAIISLAADGLRMPRWTRMVPSGG